jgi:hypothetical protein
MKTSIGVSTNGDKQIKEIHAGKLKCSLACGDFVVHGSISKDLSALRVSLSLESSLTGKVFRTKLDLFDRQHIISFVSYVTDTEKIDHEQIEKDLYQLAILLDKYRVLQLGLNEDTESNAPSIETHSNPGRVIEFLSKPLLIQRINDILGEMDIIGEENNRLLVFIIASSYKMFDPLHGCLCGSTSSGNLQILKKICSLIPQHDLLQLTCISGKSLYYFKENQLNGKVLLFPNIKGFDKISAHAFRELLLNSSLNLLSARKSIYGGIIAERKSISAKFASLSASFDSSFDREQFPDTIVMSMDESEAQSNRRFQAKKENCCYPANQHQQSEDIECLKLAIGMLKPYPVLNELFFNLEWPRELNNNNMIYDQIVGVTNQIALLNQYQRKFNSDGYLIAEPEDMRCAVELLFDHFPWNTDELYGSLRWFFEKLKTFVVGDTGNKLNEFTARDVRLKMGLSRSHIDRQMKTLKAMDYVHISGGSANRGFRYKIAVWDDNEKKKKEAKQRILQQLQQR